MPRQEQRSLIGNGSTEEFPPWSEDQVRSAQTREKSARLKLEEEHE